MSSLVRHDTPTASGPVPAAKKRRTVKKVTPDKNFSMMFSNPGPFKTLAGIIANILIDAPFILRTTEDGGYVFIDSMDPNQVCCIKAQYPVNATIEGDSDRQDFSVQMKTFNSILKQIHATSALEIYQEANKSEITIESHGQDGLRSFKLRTLQNEPKDTEFLDITSMITIHLDLSKFKTFLKAAKDLKCDEITMIVHELPGNSSVRYFTMVMRGDEGVSGQYTYQSSSKSSQGVFIAEDEDDGMDTDEFVDLRNAGTLNKVYEETFACDYLLRFTKGMEKNMISLAVGKDTPLIINYSLGIKGAEVQFILAPQMQDEEDE